MAERVTTSAGVPRTHPLVPGHLALVEVGHGRIWRVVNYVRWWNVGVNQVGSILFFLAGPKRSA